MAKFESDLYSTVSMAGVVGALRVEAPRFLLDFFFPRVFNALGKDITLDIEGEDLEIAPFVSPLSKGVIQREQGYSTKVFTPAYVKPLNVVNDDHVMTRSIGEQIGGTLSPEQRAQAILGNYLKLQTNRIVRRKEVMAAEVLRTGRCVISGPNYPTKEVDFGRDSSLTKALTGGTRWGEAGVSPYDDISAWSDAVGEMSSAAVTTVVMDSRAWALFSADPRTEKALDTTLGQSSMIALGYQPGLPGVPIYKGIIGSVEFYVYNDVYAIDGIKSKLLPEYTVILAAKPALYGLQMHGAIRSAAHNYIAGEIVSRSWIDDDLDVRKVESQSAPLVVPGRPDASMCVTVR